MVTVFILMGFFANILFQSRLLYKLGLSFYININLSTNLASKQTIKMINFSELFTCEKTEIYEKLMNQKKYIDTGKLSILIDPQGNLLLMMGPVCYGITRQTVAEYYMYENNNGQFIILSLQNKIQGNYELLVKQNLDLLITCLAQKCQVSIKGKQVKKQQILTPKQIKQPEKEEDVQIGLPLNQNDSEYVKMSKNLGNGMFIVGKYISKGIAAVGGYLASNIQPSQEIKFSQNTKQSMKQVNQWSTQAFEFSSGAVKKLISYGRQMAIDAANQDQSMKKVQQHKTINDFKNGAITGVKIFINLYDGMVEGGDQIKNGAFQGGQQILKKKYGVQAEQALRNVAGGINNVVKIYKLPKNSVKYLFKVERDQKKV